MSTKNFNEVLKERERKEQELLNEKKSDESLDSLERVKVLSPGQLVFKRFIRNKLAIVGSIILIFMFVFAFLCPLFYPYGQTEVFYKYDNSVVDYAQATHRTDYSVFFWEPGFSLPSAIKNNITGTANRILESGSGFEMISDAEGNLYKLEEKENGIFLLMQGSTKEVARVTGETKYATYNMIKDELTMAEADTTASAAFTSALKAAVKDKAKEFTVGNNVYHMTSAKKIYEITQEGGGIQYSGANLGADFETVLNDSLKKSQFVFNEETYVIGTEGVDQVISKATGMSEIGYVSNYVFDAYDDVALITDEFKVNALQGGANNDEFVSDGVAYTVKKDDDELVIYATSDLKTPVAAFSNLVIRAYNGEDILSFDFKEKVHDMVETMSETNSKKEVFAWKLAQVDENGVYTYDENGNVVEEDTDITITDKNGSFTMTVSKVVYLIDNFARPSKDHWAGTDGDGMDVLARMMYGGRVSLLVCFVVVIIETVLGVIMGGIAGFFGGWIDNIIMRLVDIFYCIPSMPILIIIGALFDAMKTTPYTRVVWLMVVLGVLGWASVARLVRGQILSLREQEFMVAAEAIGLNTKRRIFKHLVPNVMPQLIVTATSGLGGIIITESTLSFLGLGVKHPLATWGTMINSVSTAEAMKSYTYIWVPVGLLICLTVIAFNFVGDGLRDAFDPKMKR